MAHAKHEVLLVEDDAGMRQAIARMLVGAGYVVKSFESAEAVLEAPADLMLADGDGCFVCDVRLPGVSGFELHRRLCEQGPTPPWIFITAHDSAVVRGQVEHAAAAYLQKPFEGRALLALIARVIESP